MLVPLDAHLIDPVVRPSAHLVVRREHDDLPLYERRRATCLAMPGLAMSTVFGSAQLADTMQAGLWPRRIRRADGYLVRSGWGGRSECQSQWQVLPGATLHAHGTIPLRRGSVCPVRAAAAAETHLPRRQKRCARINRGESVWPLAV